MVGNVSFILVNRDPPSPTKVVNDFMYVNISDDRKNVGCFYVSWLGFCSGWEFIFLRSMYTPPHRLVSVDSDYLYFFFSTSLSVYGYS